MILKTSSPVTESHDCCKKIIKTKKYIILCNLFFTPFVTELWFSVLNRSCWKLTCPSLRVKNSCFITIIHLYEQDNNNVMYLNLSKLFKHFINWLKVSPFFFCYCILCFSKIRKILLANWENVTELVRIWQLGMNAATLIFYFFFFF